MINQDVKNALLKAIEDLVARIMAQAGMKEDEVSQLILNMFASSVEAIDPDIADKIVSPKTAALMAAKLLKDNIGDAPDDYNSIEKIGNFIPELLQQLDNQLEQLLATVKDDIATVSNAVTSLTNLLNKHGIIKVLDWTINTPETKKVVCPWSLSDRLTLSEGQYTGITKASIVELLGLYGTIGGVDYDEDVLLTIRHVKVQDVFYQYRTLYTNRGTYVSNWSSNDFKAELHPWVRPTESQLPKLREGDPIPFDQSAQYDFIGQLELAALNQAAKVPFMGWNGSYEVYDEWMAERHLPKQMVVYFTIVDGKGMWYILADALHSAACAKDTLEIWEARGARVLDHGTWLDFTAANITEKDFTFEVEVVHGNGTFKLHDMSKGAGEWLGSASSSPLPTGPFNATFSAAVTHVAVAAGGDVHQSDLTLRITANNTVSGDSQSRLLRLAHTVDNRIQQPLSLGTKIGAIGHENTNPMTMVSGSNDLCCIDPGVELRVRVFRDYGPSTKFTGVLPRPDVGAGPIKVFNVADWDTPAQACYVQLCVTMPSHEDPNTGDWISKFTDGYIVTIQFDYMGEIREFEFIEPSSLSERINGVLTGVKFEDITYLSSQYAEGEQWLSLFCGKTPQNPVSILETLFPIASVYNGTAHVGSLKILFQATPKDPFSASVNLQTVINFS